MAAPYRATPSSPIMFTSAVRLQRSLTAPLEKKVLICLAERTPRWINSDHLTLLGFAAQLLAGVSYVLARWNQYALLLVIFFLGLNWLGDSLDGTLARARNRQRPRYGFYVDHVVDTFSALFLMGGLALSGYVHPAIAFGMLVAFLMLSIESYLTTYVLGEFQLSYWMFGPTEIRLLLAVGNLALLRSANIGLFGMRLRLFDVGGVIAITGMMVMMVVCALRHTHALYIAERLDD
ncbi:MAG TPA: CDP-alcohol phosphatidyltransferase family protein [Terriglobales bacterium]|nr:CDP-alcohol phosphatidyltransferase family protein [Terriglobales bacterium]